MNEQEFGVRAQRLGQLRLMLSQAEFRLGGAFDFKVEISRFNSTEVCSIDGVVGVGVESKIANLFRDALRDRIAALRRQISELEDMGRSMEEMGFKKAKAFLIDEYPNGVLRVTFTADMDRSLPKEIELYYRELPTVFADDVLRKPTTPSKGTG